MSPRDVPILGVDVDAQGRCFHWHSDVDVIANYCCVCDAFWACSKCHEELADHDFGRTPEDDPAPNVMCGACGARFSYVTYWASSECGTCGHAFNERCHLHKDLYVCPVG
ncbi:MAG: hypothetical protein LBM94_05950 [Propionibacteriaceae bacterium]|nr:hypothetical protein [Propionibacteriaceae bacterium]